MGGKEGKGRKGPQVDQDNGPEFENRNEVRRWTGSGPAADRRHSGLGLVSEGISEEIKNFSIRKKRKPRSRPFDYKFHVANIFAEIRPLELEDSTTVRRMRHHSSL